MEYKIEKNIPMVSSNQVQSDLLIAFKKMEVGDSFEFDTSHRSSAHGCALLAGIKITTRTVSKTKVRVWRVA